MMHYNGFVVSLKVDDKFLRDQDSTVRIPFGTEYSIYLKNLESRDAVVKVSIDGKDALGGTEIIVRSNSFVELDGFLEGTSVKNKFKFIELTKKIEEYRGYQVEDSLIKIQVRYEKKKPIVQEHINVYKNEWIWDRPNTFWAGTTYSHNTSNVSYRGSSCGMASSSLSFNSPFESSDVGITVKGSETNQNFQYAHIDELEEYPFNIFLKLSGYKENKVEVKKYITTKEKVKCLTCGKENSTEFKFCPKCGTFIG